MTLNRHEPFLTNDFETSLISNSIEENLKPAHCFRFKTIRKTVHEYSDMKIDYDALSMEIL